MLSKVRPVAAIVAALIAGPSVAQTVSGVGGPRELPPAGYTQQQYVDSRGCVFLRAGLGGVVRWVPRVGQDRKAMCGYPPTFAQAREATAALNAQTEETATAPIIAPVAPAARVAAAPMPTPAPTARPAAVRVAAPLPSPITAPMAVARPAPLAVVVPGAVTPSRSVVPVLPTGTPAGTPNGNRVACFKSAPVLQRVALTNGGSALVCTRGDGSLTGWRSPVFPAGSDVGAALTPPPVAASAPAAQGGMAAAPARIATVSPGQGVPVGNRVAVTQPIPPGYVASWKDDRLNPMRGIGTAQGQAAQDQIWTRRTPAELVGQPRRGIFGFLTSGPATAVSQPVTATVTVSTKSDPAAVIPTQPAQSGPVYVQVGAFGDPANADRSIARLAAAGLPVSSQTGRGLNVILAGPFASAVAAQQALGTIRGAGFGDAFVR